jgi:hypothetical protein
MTFSARYAGRCNAQSCYYGDGQIRAGDDVTYHDDELMHAECAAGAKRGEPPLCKDCNMFHAGGECL